MNITDLLRQASQRLQEAGVESPRLDAEVLLAHAMGIDRVRIITGGDREVPDNERRSFDSMIDRRARREPAAYIMGAKEFYSLEFEVNERVLIPRPETELLVDLALYHAPRGGRVIDVGTGSGAIAVAVVRNRPDIAMTATDLSGDALALAHRNADALLGTHAIRFLQGDLFAPVAGERFDLIVSNPPYVDPALKGALQPDLAFEPELALYAGESGTAVVARIIRDARDHLADGGMALMEISETMKDFVEREASACGFAVSVLSDYAGLPRVASLTTRGSAHG
ncbi:MAG TPA: peptide chain release factor N(5)-glutamine methyltransferase [Spirochaetota bacterium]|nr:peptide chain release factor N(5)-glutamine methyltransferase [Spirochaetota bacterium]HPU88998.1 peptide chain release factor N(5)-glutamine methyltransferase [Spirochaetota bacterium]